MLTLHETQTALAAAILLGPDHVPASMFLGPAARVLLGIKVHANTISHGRLIALEDSFPRTRTAMGEARFNALSRRFIEGGGGSNAPLAMIGEHFADWLSTGRISTSLVRLAGFEWAWLSAYRAADARVFTLVQLGSLEAQSLLALPVMCHPAARLVLADRHLIRKLGLPRCQWLLITRPDNAVEVTGGGAELATLIEATARPVTISALLGDLQMAHPDANLLSLISRAIAAGALTLVETD